MIPILCEFDLLRQSLGISISGAAKILNVSEKTAYNWLKYDSCKPHFVYHDVIKSGIRKLKKMCKSSIGENALVSFICNSEFHSPDEPVVLYEGLTSEEVKDLVNI